MDDETTMLLVNTKKIKQKLLEQDHSQLNLKKLHAVFGAIESEATKKKEISSDIDSFSSYLHRVTNKAINDYCKYRKSD